MGTAPEEVRAQRYWRWQPPGRPAALACLGPSGCAAAAGSPRASRAPLPPPPREETQLRESTQGSTGLGEKKLRPLNRLDTSLAPPPQRLAPLAGGTSL